MIRSTIKEYLNRFLFCCTSEIGYPYRVCFALRSNIILRGNSNYKFEANIIFVVDPSLGAKTHNSTIEKEMKLLPIVILSLVLTKVLKM